MIRILAIFRKDARALLPRLLALWPLMALTASFDPLGGEEPDFLQRNWLLHQLHIVEAVACWMVVVGLIQQERLVGENQYWLARPIAWKELLAAKVLFLAALVDLPRLVCRYALGAPADEMRFAVYVVLPCTALATVTTNLGQAALAGIGTYFAVAMLPVMINIYQARPLPGWPSGVVIVTATVAASLLQYSRRRTSLARYIVAAAVVVVAALMNP